MFTWLPYRIQQRLWQWRIHAAIQGLARTPTMQCAGEGAMAEVHMLLCQRDLQIGVVALKSLLRFLGNRVAVALSEDGTLTETDRVWVSGHIRGCRWLPPRLAQAEIEEKLGVFPLVRSVYESTYSPIRKLIHPLLAGRSEKILIVDPDTAFLSRPVELEQWVEGTGVPALYLKDNRDEPAEVPPEVIEAFAAFASHSGESQWRIPHYYFNSGLLAFNSSCCRLPLGERFLQWRTSLDKRLAEGTAGIWFGPWTIEQALYLVLYAGFSPSPVPFSDAYRIGTGEGYVFHHFLRAGLCSSKGLKTIREVITQIGRTPSGG